MKTSHKILISVMVIIGVFILTGNGFTFSKVLRIKDGEVIGFEQMLQEIKGNRIILIGETHDNPEHHENQLQIVKALDDENIPVAIGLEMFRADNQPVLDDWVSMKLTPEEFIGIYYNNWGMPWPLYQDIFLFARKKGIPLIGLNVPKEITDRVAKYGFTALTQEEMGQLPPGISCDVDATYMKFIKRVYLAHSYAANKEFTSFCEAQMVWDTAMAWHTLKFLENRPENTAVILAGVGHAWKRAIPERIKRLNGGHNFTVILPEIPHRTERGKISPEDADFLILE